MQVVAQIQGRIDTGHKNVATVQKQLTAAEEKLEKVLMVADPAMETEDGEQLVDIFEELDEDGKVVSSRVVNASKDQEKMQEVLRGKGLTEDTDVEEQDDARANSKAKNVAFAQAPEIQELPRAPLPNKMHPSQRMLILDKDDNVIDSKPLELVHPKPAHADSEEDATIAHLREARASAQEIAPIVASFDIEPASESDTDVDMDDVDSEWSENEYGMGDIGAELTDDYKAEMEALMRKHAVAMENAGPSFDPDVMQKLRAAHRDTGLVAKAKEQTDTRNLEKNGAKGVRFAEELDISSAPEKSKTAPAEKLDKPKEPLVDGFENPVSETVLERSARPTTTDNRASSTRKPSKFKTTMNTATNRLPGAENESFVGPAENAIPQVTIQSETSLPERPKKVSRFKAAKMSS
jgi:unconventional prefoldin RPB5 interactor 1